MDGSLGLTLFALLAIAGGLWFETRVLLRWRSDRYFLASVPLGHALVPIPRAPTGHGRTPMVRWEVETPHVVRFWSEDRTAPIGLHGVVLLRESRRGVVLDVCWAPPWTLVLAPVWLAVLGVARGEAGFAVPLAAVFLSLGAAWYARSARRAAAELRWSFLACDPPPGVVY